MKKMCIHEVYQVATGPKKHSSRHFRSKSLEFTVYNVENTKQTTTNSEILDSQFCNNLIVLFGYETRRS